METLSYLDQWHWPQITWAMCFIQQHELDIKPNIVVCLSRNMFPNSSFSL